MVIRKLHESVVEKVVVFDVALFWRDFVLWKWGGSLCWLTLKWRLRFGQYIRGPRNLQEMTPGSIEPEI